QAMAEDARTAAEKARDAVKARGGSGAAQAEAFHGPLLQLVRFQPQPIRVDKVEVPVTGHDNEPVIYAKSGYMIQPFAMVIEEVAEQGKRGSLRAQVEAALVGYPIPTRGGSPPPAKAG